MKRTIAVVCVTFGLCCIGTLLHAYEARLKRILSGNEDERAKAMKEIVDSRRQLIQELIQCVADKDANVQTRSAAINLLSETRARESVAVLLDNLFIEARRGVAATEIQGIGDIPAPRALISIGMDSVQAILSEREQYLAQPIDRRTTKVYGYIIDKVLGRPMASTMRSAMRGPCRGSFSARPDAWPGR